MQAHLAAARRRVRSPAKRAAVDGLAGYFAGQAGRLGYAERLALGQAIGSGLVEGGASR